MPRKEHLHTYELYKKRSEKGKCHYQAGSKIYFRCTDPDCTAIYDKEFLVGKRARCPLCGEAFILTKADLKLLKPRCLGCSDTKKGRAYRAAQALLQQQMEPTEPGESKDEDEIEEDIFLR